MIEYEAIVKLECMDREEHQLMAYLGAESKSKTGSKVENAYGRNSGLSEDEIVRAYLETLSDEEVEALYQMYKHDFIFFRYSFRFRNKTYPPETKDESLSCF